MRGMNYKESAQTLMKALRIYHNYFKTHQGLDDGKTPAEASGIRIVEDENKYNMISWLLISFCVISPPM
jgi:hypothetical protein